MTSLIGLTAGQTFKNMLLTMIYLTLLKNSVRIHLWHFWDTIFNDSKIFPKAVVLLNDINFFIPRLMVLLNDDKQFYHFRSNVP